MMKISNRIVTVNRAPVFFGDDAIDRIGSHMRTLHPSGIFILVDRNTRQHCLSYLLQQNGMLAGANILDTEPGESSKSLENAGRLWNELLASGADRAALLINLGGGVVSDLGGFVAAGYKRGINYINVPTSLIGQADAAIGGKTAINSGNAKNQIGFFYSATGIFIYPGFLKTLPHGHLRSGLAEIVKCALVSDLKSWRKISSVPIRELLTMAPDCRRWNDLVAGTVKFKNKVVMKDFHEKNLRGVLNFGHTIGHALEGLSMRGDVNPLFHGDAVAAGMICAAWLSQVKTGLPAADMNSITKFIAEGFPLEKLEEIHKNELLSLLKQDKKMKNGKIHFTLITKPGHPVINIPCEPGEITDAILFYNTIVAGKSETGGYQPGNQ